MLGVPQPEAEQHVRAADGTVVAGRWLGYLFLVAGAAATLNTVVRGYPGFDIPGLVGLAAGAFTLGGAVLLVGGRVQRWALHGLLVVGNAAIAAAIHFTQGVPNAGSLLYLWIALYAFYFFSARAAWVHMALVGVSYAVAIALRPPPFPPVAHWATTVIAMATAGAFVGILKGRLDASLGQLRRLVDTDPLTGLANRRGWTARAAIEIGRAAREGEALGIALVDLDGFKEFNDRHGHGAGDRLLQDCATAWASSLREVDFVARLGGDEFGVLLPGCGADASAAAVDRLQGAVAANVRCSVGIAQWSRGETIEQSLARADHALYEVKRGRRARGPVQPPRLPEATSAEPASSIKPSPVVRQASRP